MIETRVNEVEVLQYFEQEPIEKAKLLYNLVRHKMEKRLQGEDVAPSSVAPRKRRSQAGTVPGQQEEVSPAGE